MIARIQKIISTSGICSRRKAEDLIRDGRVRVNGKTAYIGQKADIRNEIISIDNYIIPTIINYKLFLIHYYLSIDKSLDEYSFYTSKFSRSI